MLVARSFAAVALVLLFLTACATSTTVESVQTVEIPPPEEEDDGDVVAPEPDPSPSPAPTPVPTSTPVPVPSPTPEPTATAVPTPDATATPQPDDDSEPVAWYIESIAAKEYDGCCIERLRVYEEGGNYTSWVIAYQGDGLRLTGLMAVPHGEGPFPVAILNHGFFPFDQYDTGYDTLREVRFFASHGYIAIAPDYRNYAGSDPGDHIFVPGYVHDVRNLIYAIQELPEAQGDRIGMMGHSMGGGITMQNMVSGAPIRAAALYGTVTASEAERYEARISRWVAAGSTGSNRAVDFAERYGTPEVVPEVYARMSVASYWDRVGVPVIIHHGDADTVTPLQWALDIEAGLRAAEKSVEMHIYPYAGHSFQGADFEQMMLRTLVFFDTHVRGG